VSSELRADPLSGLRLLLAGEEPLLSPDGPAPAPGSQASGPMLDRSPNPNKDLFWSSPARGQQETIEHDGPGTPPRPLAALSVVELIDAVERWRERIAAHSDAACVHLSVQEAGAGEPSTAQLYALPSVPQLVAREREHFGAYATRTMGGNLLADLVQEEVRLRERIVAIDDEAVLVAPYGSRVPYQLLLAPRTPRARFEDLGPTGAAMLHQALRRLTARFGATPAFSLWVRTAPSGAESFSWRIDLLPRLSEPSALELGTGLLVNPVTPEHAAAELREL
jgi:UDPglucose--hexose-1-phosphate uridylyltransferase